MYKIFLQPCNELQNLESYLMFNEFLYECCDLWNDNEKTYLFNSDLNKSLYIVSPQVFIRILSNKLSADSFFKFIKNNRCLVTSTVDSGQILVDCPHLLLELDNNITKNKVFFVLDALHTDRSVFARLKNIVVHSQPLFQELSYDGCPRFNQGKTFKNKNSKDFLLTTIIDSRRLNNGRSLHRKILLNKIEAHQHLFENSFLIFHKRGRENQNWLGSYPHVPIIDLYSNSNVEIVPETRYKFLYQPTEKTWKPIITKTPFLICSNAGYLKYLHTLGFKTFDSLIDESYDQYFHVQDRTDKIISSIKDIKQQGSENFYKSCKDILDHNYNRLCELYGGGQLFYDRTMTEILNKITDTNS